MLADLGADVVKVEHPVGGDDVRRMGMPLKDRDGNETSEMSSFLAMNRGKQSITIDIAKPEGQELVRKLAAQSDVVLENFKVGTLKRYGLDFEALKAVNSRLVYCSISGFGQTGPYAPLPGYDAIFQAMSGLMSITGAPDGQPDAGPSLVGYSVSDINAGFYASIAILAALNHRDNVSGEGQHIDIALFDAQIAASSHIAMNYLLSGKMPVRAGAASQINCPWQAFDCSDQPLMIAVGNNQQFERLCTTLDVPNVASDARFVNNRVRMQNQTALIDILAAAFATRTARDWMDRLNAVGVPSGPINDFGQVFEDPQAKHRGVLTEVPHPLSGSLPVVANPIRLSATPVAYRSGPPLHGEHSRAILQERLNLTNGEIDALAERKII